MIKIAGTVSALPQQCVASTSLDQVHDHHGSLGGVTGVVQRYVIDHETQIDLAVMACKAAINDADYSLGDIDVVISGSAIPYQSIPATAP